MCEKNLIDTTVNMMVYTDLDLPKGAEWMTRGAYTPSFRIKQQPLERCWDILTENIFVVVLLAIVYTVCVCVFFQINIFHTCIYIMFTKKYTYTSSVSVSSA